MDSVIDAQAAALDKSAEYNFRKWKVMGSSIVDFTSELKNGTSFREEVESLKNWISRRYEWLDTQWGE